MRWKWGVGVQKSNSEIDMLKVGCIETGWGRVEGKGKRIIDGDPERQNLRVEAMERSTEEKKKWGGGVKPQQRLQICTQPIFSADTGEKLHCRFA